jgi:hypothetical protein
MFLLPERKKVKVFHDFVWARNYVGHYHNVFLFPTTTVLSTLSKLDIFHYFHFCVFGFGFFFYFLHFGRGGEGDVNHM